jgi:hypothetical protein
VTKKLNNVDENVKEFFARYGEEGFLQLFLTNYLYELIQYFLHSKMSGEDDLSLLYYVPYQNKIYSLEENEDFENKLRKECQNSAKKIVKELTKSNTITKIGRYPLEHPEVAKLLADEFESILSQLDGGAK